jgi:periplasmic divalent cation tolerance protein
MAKSYVIVMVAAGDKQEARNLCMKLLEEKLIACANIIGPVSSHFHWSGKIETTEEYIVFMKSRADLFESISERITEIHSYEVPEILALKVVNGSQKYLRWLDSVLKP